MKLVFSDTLLAGLAGGDSQGKRHFVDLAQRGFAVPELAELAAQIAERDHLDSSRAVAPLIQAADAVELITDGLSIAAVIDQLELLFRERVPADAWPGPAQASGWRPCPGAGGQNPQPGAGS